MADSDLPCTTPASRRTSLSGARAILVGFAIGFGIDVGMVLSRDFLTPTLACWSAVAVLVLAGAHSIRMFVGVLIGSILPIAVLALLLAAAFKDFALGPL